MTIEVMAPVGSYEALAAAIKAKAGSVYFGIEQLNMRSQASKNFTNEDLKTIVKKCKEHNIKTYVTLNTVMYDHDVTLSHKICDTCKEAGVTAIIAADLAAIAYANQIGLEVHMSTQVNISNIEAVKFWAKYADVMVLARELTIQQIKHICQQIKEQNITGPKGKLIEIEIFVHGALCVAISGKCYMSLATYNASANRGACQQNCRRAYKITDEETGDELVVDNKYIMSPKDLNTIGFIDKIIDAGVQILKIEGRGKGPEYVFEAVDCYKQAIQAVQNNEFTKEKVAEWNERLSKVYNRGFWQGGYYLGKKLGEWSGTYGSQATEEKVLTGIVTNYFRKSNIGEVKLESGKLNINDELLFTGTTTGMLKTKIASMHNDQGEITQAQKGDVISVPVPERVRKGDKVFLLKPREATNA